MTNWLFVSRATTMKTRCRGLLEADNTFESSNKLASLEMNWDVTDSLALVSLTGYKDVDSSDWRDIDRANAVPGAIQVQAVDIYYDPFTQEIRLSSTEPAFGMWNYMVGAFYKDHNIKSTGADGTTASYATLNLFVGVRDAAGTWEASVWANNLFDREAETTKTAEEVIAGLDTGRNDW